LHADPDAGAHPHLDANRDGYPKSIGHANADVLSISDADLELDAHADEDAHDCGLQHVNRDEISYRDAVG
jgi:hypothetical protein